MSSTDLSRRLFLQQGAAVAGSQWAKLVLPALATLSQAAAQAQEAGAAFKTLSPDEAREIDAISARILPTTDTPGARDAGVVYFFDQTLATFNAPMLNPLRGMMQQFQGGVPGGESFSSLSETDQDAYLETQAETPLFGMLRFLTLCGFFGMQKYGGNKEGAGYSAVGMQPGVHVYTSPFGYYDAEYLKENPNG